MALAIGKMRHRIRLEQPVVTQTASGEQSTSWEAVAVRWAQVRPLSGRELFTAQQVSADITAEIVLRHYPGVKSSWRIVKLATDSDDERTFHLTTPPIDVDERGEQLRLMVKEVE